MKAIPEGYGWESGPVSLATYFGLARGATGRTDCCDHPSHARAALEMTKWFDTNYHYLVPILSAGQQFNLTENRPLAHFREALALGIRTRPVILGPVSFLLLAKTADGSDPLDLLPRLLPVYRRILAELHAEACVWVQIDEPSLVLDLPEKARVALAEAYDFLAASPTPRILLTASHAGYGQNLGTVLGLPVAGVHFDLVRAVEQLDLVLMAARPDQYLSLGLVDGRNVWRTDLRAALALLKRVVASRGGEHLMVAPSCSLLHVPVDLAQERRLDPALQTWLAFAVQKLDEVAALARGVDEGEAAIGAALVASDQSLQSRAAHPARGKILPFSADDRRAAPYAQRRPLQAARLRLPFFPTTTIGSFPQTAEIRANRAALGRGQIDQATYERAIEGWTQDCIHLQETIGLDVLVHGEFERNDMVKYFGEQLAGYAFTQHGWVQSYGSRCVAPPIIWGNVSRPAPMTVRWAQFAQSLTDRPVKGMLTGPVTMLQWSFVRDDIPRAEVCRQIALALRAEVSDLEQAGISIIQVDEPAFREGVPLRRAARPAYLAWAAACFRLATSGVRPDTAIHTHMCYSEFNDILPAIADLDADAISIETTRSRMELLDAFIDGDLSYPAEIGPGVWDIHSPRVPSAVEMLQLLRLARKRLADWQIWVNPDCGLKTRSWEEVRLALVNMVQAAKILRETNG